MIKRLPKFIFIQDDETGLWYCGFRHGVSLEGGRTREEARLRFIEKYKRTWLRVPYYNGRFKWSEYDRS